MLSLIRTKCIDETKPHLNKKKNGILYISDRFEKHLQKLNETKVTWNKYEKKNWLEAKFQPKLIRSVKNVILSELCRIYCDINPYTSGAYTDNCNDILLLDSNERAANGKQIFQNIADYSQSHWNYIFLINYMNSLKNGEENSADNVLSRCLTGLQYLLIDKGFNITQKMLQDMEKAKSDILYYVENLKLEKFWKSLEINKQALLLCSENQFYDKYKVSKKTGAPYGIANMKNNCYITAVIEMLYSNKKIRDKIKEMAEKVDKPNDNTYGIKPTDIDVNDGSHERDQENRKKIFSREDYTWVDSNQVVVWLDHIFKRLDTGTVSSAYILELVNRINKCNIIKKRQKNPKAQIRLDPLGVNDAKIALEILVSALAGIGLEYDYASLNKMRKVLKTIDAEAESIPNLPKVPKDLGDYLVNMAKQQKMAQRLANKTDLEDWIIIQNGIGKLFATLREEISEWLNVENHDATKTQSYPCMIQVDRNYDDLQKCLDNSISKQDVSEVECLQCGKQTNEKIFHQRHTQVQYRAEPQVLVLDVVQDLSAQKQFSKLRVPDYLNFGDRQYVLRSAIIGQPGHYVMKGIAQNGDIYCINDDASAIMKSNPKKPGTAHYVISNGRKLTGKKHRDNPSIEGDKTLNHLDVEDGILFMYERIDW